MPLCKACGKSPSFHHCLPFCPKCDRIMSARTGINKEGVETHLYTYYACPNHGKQYPVMKDICPVCGAEIEVKGRKMNEDETPVYKAAETAYVPFFQDMMRRYEERIKKHIREDKNEDWPSWEELMSEKFAKDTFHGYAYIEAIIQRIVKGRGYE